MTKNKKMESTVYGEESLWPHWPERLWLVKAIVDKNFPHDLIVPFAHFITKLYRQQRTVVRLSRVIISLPETVRALFHDKLADLTGREEAYFTVERQWLASPKRVSSVRPRCDFLGLNNLVAHGYLPAIAFAAIIRHITDPPPKEGLQVLFELGPVGSITTNRPTDGLFL
jgi:hypothetical protein